MIIRCKFDVSNNSYGFIKKEGVDEGMLFRDSSSPLLDKCVKLVYPPKELGIPVAVITFRFMMEKCPVCSGKLCAGATTDQKIGDRALSVIQCEESKTFAYVRGVPKARSNDEV